MGKTDLFGADDDDDETGGLFESPAKKPVSRASVSSGSKSANIFGDDDDDDEQKLFPAAANAKKAPTRGLMRIDNSVEEDEEDALFTSKPAQPTRRSSAGQAALFADSDDEEEDFLKPKPQSASAQKPGPVSAPAPAPAAAPRDKQPSKKTSLFDEEEEDGDDLPPVTRKASALAAPTTPAVPAAPAPKPKEADLFPAEDDDAPPPADLPPPASAQPPPATKLPPHKKPALFAGSDDEDEGGPVLGPLGVKHASGGSLFDDEAGEESAVPPPPEPASPPPPLGPPPQDPLASTSPVLSPTPSPKLAAAAAARQRSNLFGDEEEEEAEREVLRGELLAAAEAAEAEATALEAQELPAPLPHLAPAPAPAPAGGSGKEAAEIRELKDEVARLEAEGEEAAQREAALSSQLEILLAQAQAQAHPPTGVVDAESAESMQRALQEATKREAELQLELERLRQHAAASDDLAELRAELAKERQLARTIGWEKEGVVKAAAEMEADLRAQLEEARGSGGSAAGGSVGGGDEALRAELAEAKAAVREAQAQASHQGTLLAAAQRELDAAAQRAEAAEKACHELQARLEALGEDAAAASPAQVDSVGTGAPVKAGVRRAAPPGGSRRLVRPPTK